MSSRTRSLDHAVTGRPLRVAHVTTVDLTLRFLLLAQLRRLREEGFDVSGISADGEWTEDLRREGIRHIPWPSVTRSWNPTADARAFRDIYRILRKERFDLVHVHTAKAGVMGRIAARLAAVPCVVDTVHGLYALPTDPARRRFPVLALEAFAALFSDLELYQSSEDLAWARRLRLAHRRKLELLGNGADLSTFDPDAVPPARLEALRNEIGLNSAGPIVGMVGRLVAEKGYREFFEAAREIRRSHPGVQFVAVGRVEEEKWDAIRSEEIEQARSDVTFVGWREDVRDVMALFDVFVLPSWREGLPRSAIEAAAMGKAMVLTDIRGCREVARDGVEAILVPPKTSSRLAEAIIRLVEDPALRSAMGGRARARALTQFDEQAVCDRILVHYRRLLGAKGLRSEAVRSSREEDFEPTGVRIRRAHAGDVAALATLHLEIPYAFMRNLGASFLRVFYRALVSSPDAVVFVAENGNGVIGFVSGVTSTRAFNRRFVRRYGLRAAMAAAPWVVRPEVLRGAMESARYASNGSSNHADDRVRGTLPEAELVSIAVDPGARVRGVGRALTHELLTAMAARHVDELKVMVREENELANRFYERAGFQAAGVVRIHDRKPSRIWVAQCQS